MVSAYQIDWELQMCIGPLVTAWYDEYVDLVTQTAPWLTYVASPYSVLQVTGLTS
jgi:hypothetical protein